MRLEPYTIAKRLFLIIVLILFIFTSVSRSAHDTKRIHIVISKTHRLLTLYENGRPVKKYRVCMGPLDGPKTVTGDKKTPEGDYFICTKNTTSKYHLFLGLSYPNPKDITAAYESGVIDKKKYGEIMRRIKDRDRTPWNTELGGWVGIHGYPTDDRHRMWMSILHPKPDNWTDGCIALWNFEIEELFARVPLGTSVKILP
jgi:murein L,D-transpeptidase YafK